MEFEDAYTFPRDTLTAYRGRAGVGDFYSLETLLVWLRHGVTTDPAAGACSDIGACLTVRCLVSCCLMLLCPAPCGHCRKGRGLPYFRNCNAL